MGKEKTTRATLLERLDALEERLREIDSRVAALRDTGLDAAQAKSVDDFADALAATLANLPGTREAIESGSAEHGSERASELHEHVGEDVLRARTIEDLREVLREAEEEGRGLPAKRRKPHRTFVESWRTMLDELPSLGELSRTIRDGAVERAARTRRQESDMTDDEPTGVEEALRAIGRQLSFIGTAPGTSGGSGAGDTMRFRSTADQLIASLDALGLPHHGVQFATGVAAESARDGLIEGLLDAYRPVERDGNVLFEPGRSDGRDLPGEPSTPRLAGAAKVAARLVRAEGDNVLDILDRLPDKTRFRARRGVATARTLRDVVAGRLGDLDEVMLDPMGVNPPRARFALRRVGSALLDFMDQAELEREFVAALERDGLCDTVLGEFDEPVAPDEDEVGTRRGAVESEEIGHEIAELIRSLRRIEQRIGAPFESRLGTSAARLGESLEAARRSALDLSELLVRSGSSLPEQDLQFFMTDLRTDIERSGHEPKVELSIGQLLDWIVDVARPVADARDDVESLEIRDARLLAGELDCQCAALDDLIEAARRLDFAIRLPGPMRQLEELRFHVAEAAVRAGKLTGAAA